MKRLLTNLTIVSSLVSLSAFSSGLERLDSEDLMNGKLSKIESSINKSVDDKRKRVSIFKAIKEARQDYKQWKEENPNHKEIKREFRRVKKLMKTKGSLENVALMKVKEVCEKDPNSCESVLTTNLESIYNNSEISIYTQKKKVSILPQAYAYGVSATSCVQNVGGFHDGGPITYHALLFGQNQGCNISFFGPGALVSAVNVYAYVCAGEFRGIKVGPYATVQAAVGLGAGLLVGAGMCQMISVHAGSIGAFAGLAIADI